MPHISVIVPVYKVELYLRRCVDSILTQTFTDFELILVDDGSPDNCGTICDEYAEKDQRVHVIHRRNGGLSAARNTGIDWVFANSNSEYISFVDSDDWVHPRFLELLYEGIQRFRVNICQCRFLKTDGTEDIPEVNNTFKRITPTEHYAYYYSAAVWNKLFSRSCWNTIRFPEGQIYEDVAIWYRIIFAEQSIALVDEVLYYYYINPEGIMRSQWTPAQMAQIRGWDEQLAFLRDNGSPEAIKVIRVKYIKILWWHYQRIKLCDRISPFEKTLYMARVRRKMEGLMRETGFGEERWIYEQLHPIRERCYWTARGVAGKVKRLLK
jgi:glycosyltransferase involved in cell wall biosynthesis